MSEFEMTRLSLAEREKAFNEMMASAAKLPFIPTQNGHLPLPRRIAPSRGIAQLAKAKGRVLAKRPAGIRKVRSR
jgi:hypothetical protein